MNSKNNIEHQFINTNFFFPDWKVKTLVLGTFNPNCGEKTDYFYGRCQNNFWRTMEDLYQLDFMWFQNNFQRKQEFMKKHEFGCTDVIKSIWKSDLVEIKEICGAGYSDSILFTAKKCTLSYNFEEIKSFIKKNNVEKLIHTWGKRESPLNFRKHINELKIFCSQNKVLFIDECPSPSGRIRGKINRELLINFYKLHIFDDIDLLDRNLGY